MGYIFILLPIIVLVGLAIWKKTKKIRNVIIYLIIIISIPLLIFGVLLLIAIANGEAIFPNK